MKILVACEESQEVCKAFRIRGHEAYSCDLVDCSGGVPEWHIKQDVIPLLNGRTTFYTSDGTLHGIVDKWDMIIAHPPCTFLTNTGNRWFDIQKFGESAKQRYKERYKAIIFFMYFVNADCERIAIENPVGVMNTAFRKPNFIIHPYYFGDDAKKKTCFWTKGLPDLKPTNIIEPTTVITGKSTDSPWHAFSWNLPIDERRRFRSKTFPGIARAMAEQWG